MQHSVVKFITYLRRRCSTRFGCHYAHHQGLSQTAVAASGFRTNAEVDVFPRLETHPPGHLYGNRRLRLQFVRTPDDGRNDARNMLNSVYVNK
jgi:hypothetical protein